MNRLHAGKLELTNKSTGAGACCVTALIIINAGDWGRGRHIMLLHRIASPSPDCVVFSTFCAVIALGSGTPGIWVAIKAQRG